MTQEYNPKTKYKIDKVPEKCLDITGYKTGYLTVENISYYRLRKNGKYLRKEYYWKCSCECGIS
jgi:hypothetical protein